MISHWNQAEHSFIAHPFFVADQRPSGWYIFEDRDLNPEIIYTSDPVSTTIRLGGLQILANRAISVRIYVLPSQGSIMQRKLTCNRASSADLGNLHVDFANVRVAYSFSYPRTHLFIRNYSFHMPDFEQLTLLSYNSTIYTCPSVCLKNLESELKWNQRYMRTKNILNGKAFLKAEIIQDPLIGYQGKELQERIPTITSLQSPQLTYSKDDSTLTSNSVSESSPISFELCNKSQHPISKSSYELGKHLQRNESNSHFQIQIPKLSKNFFFGNRAASASVEYQYASGWINAEHSPMRFKDAFNVAIDVNSLLTPEYYARHPSVPFSKPQVIFHNDNFSGLNA